LVSFDLGSTEHRILFGLLVVSILIGLGHAILGLLRNLRNFRDGL
jgi:hypothetical protein